MFKKIFFSPAPNYATQHDMDNLQNISPYLRLCVSPRAKRIALRLDTKDRVMRLVVPRRTNMKRAYLFAKQHKDWIEEKVSSLPENIPFEDGVTIPVLGRQRTFHIFYDDTLKTTDIMLKPNDIIVTTNKEEPQARITRFLKEEARTHLADAAHEKAALIGKKIKAIQVRDTKSRWGSCSEDAHLSFSWRLIFAPAEALDYVVAHEVAHLRYLNHSPEFWKVCEDLSLNYKKGKRWIRDNGHTLLRYGQPD